MVYIKFNNDLTPYKGNVKRQSENIVSIEFEIPMMMNSSGFKTYRDYTLKEQMGDFTDYTTVYDLDTFSLSNDGSVKPIPPVPPIQVHTIKFSINETQGELIGETTFSVEHGSDRSEITPPTVNASENYQFNGFSPSIESGEVVSNERYVASMEYIPTLDEVKMVKVAELSAICSSSIENGVTIEIDGEEEHFSYGLVNGDQGNIDDLFSIADKSKMAQPYHCDGGSCKLYTLEQITTLFVAQKMNKTHHTTYFNQLKQMVNSCTSKDDVNEIYYGQELEGDYLEIYTEIMEHSQSVITAMLGASEEVTNE